MNKLYQTIILFSLVFFILNCDSTKRSIIITQKKTRKAIIIKSSLKDSIIYSIKIPNKLGIKNKTLLSKSFIMIDYLYKDSLSNWANRNIALYSVVEEKLEEISNNKKKTIPSNDSLTFVYYTRHFVDSARSIQDQFKPYIEKMLSENKDTLHIGTVKEFKAKHAELFKRLTKDDSISIQFLDGKELGERITVPVRW